MKKTIKFTFKKGEIRHLDSFYDVCAFAQKPELMKQHRNKYLHRWDSELSEEYEILKDFTVEVEITTKTK